MVPDRTGIVQVCFVLRAIFGAEEHDIEDRQVESTKDFGGRRFERCRFGRPSFEGATRR
jgi:hypothetical protein